jgi:uncharacterized protein
MMRLNLHEIIDIPGGSVPFQCELDVDRLDFPSVKLFAATPHAEGEVRNTAGVLTLRGTLTADMVCICDRCGREFDCAKTLKLEVPLAAELQNEENPDIFPLDGDWLDLSDVLETCFILDMETKFLCREDCAGLCDRCGANLNLGPCSCGAKLDPRLAVLGQLLDNTKE